MLTVLDLEVLEVPHVIIYPSLPRPDPGPSITMAVGLWKFDVSETASESKSSPRT